MSRAGTQTVFSVYYHAAIEVTGSICGKLPVDYNCMIERCYETSGAHHRSVPLIPPLRAFVTPKALPPGQFWKKQ